MTSFANGRRAEAVAAAYLRRAGYDLVTRNWRTRWCEVDVIAHQRKIIHFIEVKYRQSNQQGQGLDYITPLKLKQMRFAAELWVSQRRWLGEYRLGALEVSGTDYRVTNFLSDL